MSYITMQCVIRKSKLTSLICCRGSWFLSFMWLTFWQRLYPRAGGLKISGSNCGSICCCVWEEHVCQMGRQTWANFQKPEKAQRHGGRGGVDRSHHLNARLQPLSLSPFLFRDPKSSAIDTLWLSQWGGELERERGGWKERNIQTEGNVRGRIFREGKVRSEWAYMGGFHCWCFLCIFFFLLPFWVTRPSSLRNQWHNAVDADWNFKLGRCVRKSEFDPTLPPSPCPPTSPINTHTYRNVPHLQVCIHATTFYVWRSVFAVQIAGSLCLGAGSHSGGNVWVLPCVSCSRWCGLPAGVTMMNGLLGLSEVFMTERRCCM